MVAVQVLLMNYFLLGLHHEHQHMNNDVILPDLVMEVGCGHGCSQCTAINGCVSCKPPFYLLLHRDETQQTGSCTRACPAGFYNLRRRTNKSGFCAKCMLRGCRECSTRHYCSVCKPGLVRHAGRCRKKCPAGTTSQARSPALCLPTPAHIPDLTANEIAVGNGSWARPVTPQPIPDTNTSSTVSPSTTTKRKRKKKRKKGKGKRRYRHRRRKYKERLRNRRRKEKRRRKLRKLREKRKKLSTPTANVTTTTMATGS